MSRIVELTVTLKLDVASRLSRAGFYDSLADLLRTGLGEVLSPSADNVTVVAAHDPESVLSQTTNLIPVLKPVGEIAVVWSAEDVLALRPDLTRDEAVQVLEYGERHHDAGDGINWHALDTHAEHLFGPAPEPVAIAS